MLVPLNASKADKEMLRLIFNFSLEVTFGSYFGNPIVLPSSKTCHFAFLVDYLQRRLQG